MTSGAMGTPAGALDGWVARYDAAGRRAWLQQFGTAGNEEVWGLTADAAGNTYVAAYSAGSFAGPLAGDKDIVAARFDPNGVMTWADQLGTDLNDKGAAIGLDGVRQPLRRRVQRRQHRDERRQVRRVLVKYAPDTTREWTRQFGTAEDDGADAFAEANLYLATSGDTVYVSGLTLGDVDGATQIGLGDVFLAGVRRRGRQRLGGHEAGGAGIEPGTARGGSGRRGERARRGASRRSRDRRSEGGWVEREPQPLAGPYRRPLGDLGGEERAPVGGEQASLARRRRLRPAPSRRRPAAPRS